MLSDPTIAAARDNFLQLRQDAGRLFVPIVRQPIVEWLENRVHFGKSGGIQLESHIGPMSFADRPWFRFPLECFASRDCQSIALPAATQIGKTANLLIGTILWAAEFRPAPGMLVMPDELEAKKFRDRIYAIVKSSEHLKPFSRIKLQPEHRWNMQEIHLGSMLIHLAWAGSRQRTRGKPCWYLWFSEVDVYPDADPKAGDPVEAGKQRTKDVLRYKHVFESSPRESPSTICEEEAIADDRWRWHVRCPFCQQLQEVRFFPHRTGDLAGKGGIEMTVKAIGQTGAELMTARQARESAYYVCLRGCKIPNDRKTSLMESGNWYPRGWREDSEPVRRAGRTMGFHLWAAHSPYETWGTIAADYVEHVRKGKKVDFYGNRLAIAYESEAKVPSWVDLGRKMAWTNSRRTVPSECWFLTAGIDKQGENNGSRYVIRGWAPGRTSWLIDWGWVERVPGDETDLILSDLRGMQSRVFDDSFSVVDRDNRVAKNPLGKSSLKVRLGCIDTKHLPAQIHRWMRSLPENWLDRLEGKKLQPGRVRAIHGDHRPNKSDLRYRHSLVETNSRTGEKYEGGLHLWALYVYPYYSDLTELLAGEPGHAGSWYVTADALSQGRDYLEQVVNFGYSVKYDPRKGKKGEWGPRTNRVPNDFWDCEIYAMAAAEMVVGDLGWNEEAWSSWGSRGAEQQEARKKVVRRESAEEIGAR